MLAEPDLQHADEVGINLLLLHVRGVDLEEEAFEDLLDTEDIEVVFLMNVLDCCLQVLALEIRVLLQQVLLDFDGRFVDRSFEQHHLVWDNAQLSDHQSLILSSWESFNDPVLIFFLEVSDLLSD